MKQPPIVICTVNGKCLPVLLASIEAYVPDEVKVYLSVPSGTSPNPRYTSRCYILLNRGSSFGESYNRAIQCAFDDGHTEVVVANDDVVLLPDTWKKMLSDIETLKGTNVGWLAARSDWARGWQNIRSRLESDTQWNWLRWPSEDTIEPADIIAPIFAWIRRKAWVNFPPINWFSDDIQCRDVSAKGYQNYIGSFYVHHVGSQSVGMDAEKLTKEAIDWVRINRPDISL